MKTYKLGNKIKCIVRSCAKGKIGSQEIMYGNQPYTILKDVEASLRFEDKNISAKGVFNNLFFNQDKLQEITISNVELNDKILNMIFLKNEEKLCSTVDSTVLIDNSCQIKTQTDKIYQVFIYNCDGQLIAATGEYELEDGYSEIYISKDKFELQQINGKEVEIPNNEEILVFYSYIGDQSYKLEKDIDNIQYFTLDFIIDGNVDDITAPSFIHIDKSSLVVDKNMYFNRTLNAVDLKFIVINDNESNNYITLLDN